MRMPPTTSATTPSMAVPACGFSAASRWRTALDALSNSTRKCCRGMSERSPTSVASASSPVERLTNARKPASENRAPTFLTTE